jgi:hypothetical protein
MQAVARKVMVPADLACEAADALPHEALREKILLYRFAAREQNPDAAYKLASYLVHRFGAGAMCVPSSTLSLSC